MRHPAIPSYWRRVEWSQVSPRLGFNLPRLGLDLPRLGLLCCSWHWLDPACNAELLICFWLHQAGLNASAFPIPPSMLRFPISVPPPASPVSKQQEIGEVFSSP